ncbi:MAG: oxidoreductase [Cyclobacteriaceae bacterium]|nr:MAG: oxidoreductase [Cyclobacteriaceae bacterium]
MKKVLLGNTRQLISEICLGTMYFGTKVDSQQSNLLLDKYVDAGGNFIDTANNYAFWWNGATGNESEELIGNWLKEQTREHLVIATKCGARPTKYQGDLETVQFEGLSYDTIMKTVEDSLTRLKTDYIDLLYAHVDFLDFPIEERLIAFTKLQEQGKVKYVGISNTESWRIQESLQTSKEKNYAKYCCVQQKYSYLRPKRSADLWLQKLISDEMLHLSNLNNEFTLVAYSTLLSGGYTKSVDELPEEYQTTDNMLRMALLKSLAEAKGCSLNQLVLAWMMHQNPRIVPIVSGSGLEQIEENLGACAVKLNGHEIMLLNKAGE